MLVICIVCDFSPFSTVGIIFNDYLEILLFDCVRASEQTFLTQKSTKRKITVFKNRKEVRKDCEKYFVILITWKIMLSASLSRITFASRSRNLLHCTSKHYFSNLPKLELCKLTRGDSESIAQTFRNNFGDKSVSLASAVRSQHGQVSFSNVHTMQCLCLCY